MTTKMTVFFTTAQAGWSETWYVPDQTDQTTLVSKAIDWSLFRAALLGSNSQITYMRFSKLLPPILQGQKNSFVTTPFLTGKPRPGTFGTTSDFSDTRALCRCYDSTGFAVKNWFIGGIPDALVQDGGVFSPINPWQKNFDDFINQSKTFGLGWYGGTALNTGNVTAVTPQLSNQIAITVDAAVFTGLQPGYRLSVRMSQLQGCLSLNGRTYGNREEPHHVLDRTSTGYYPLGSRDRDFEIF